MTSKLLTAVLAAVLGVSVGAFSYAADTSEASRANRSAALSDAEASAMQACRKLIATEQARCIVNVRPTSAGDNGGMAPEATTSKDRNDGTDADYAVALKECDAADVADRDRCISAVKVRFGLI